MGVNSERVRRQLKEIGAGTSGTGKELPRNSRQILGSSIPQLEKPGWEGVGGESGLKMKGREARRKETHSLRDALALLRVLELVLKR